MIVWWWCIVIAETVRDVTLDKLDQWRASAWWTLLTGHVYTRTGRRIQGWTDL